MMNEKLMSVVYGAAGVVLGLGIGYIIGSEKMRRKAIDKINSAKEKAKKFFNGEPVDVTVEEQE